MVFFILLNEMSVFRLYIYIQGESLDRGPKLLSIKNYVIGIMT